MKSLKKTAEKLCDAAIADGVKFPERWRRPMIIRACSSTLVTPGKNVIDLVLLTHCVHFSATS